MKLKESIFFNKLSINKKISVLNSSLFIEQVYIPTKTIYYRNKKLYEYLKKKKFLINRENEDIDFIEKVASKNIKKEFNLLRVLLTDLCNLKCKYCKVCSNIKNPVNTPTPLSNFCKAVDELFARNEKEKIIHITGGEPLLFYKQLKVFINYIRRNYPIKNYKYIIVVGTNGFLLDNQKIAFFKKNKIKLIISLDGRKKSNLLRINKSGNVSFSYVIRAIKKVEDAGMEYGISMVVGKHNIKEFDKDINYILKKFTPSSFGVNFIKNTNLLNRSPYLINGVEFADTIYKIHKKHRAMGVFFELLARKIFPFVYQEFRLNDCGASNGTTININAEGNTGICKSLLFLSDQISKRVINQILKKTDRRSPIFNKYCQKCPALGICGNGCIYESFISDKKDFIDKRACDYMLGFCRNFLIDLFELNRKKAIIAIKKNGYYVPSLSDRKKMLGRVKKNKMGLKQCIGHEI